MILFEEVALLIGCALVIAIAFVSDNMRECDCESVREDPDGQP